MVLWRVPFFWIGSKGNEESSRKKEKAKNTFWDVSLDSEYQPF